MGTSKTARRSSPGSAQAFRREGAVKWVVPLAGGAYARVADPHYSKLHHVKTDSPAFVESVRAVVAAGRGEELRAELEALGWEIQLNYLEANDAFGGSEEEEAA